jgi:hypothetical protein
MNRTFRKHQDTQANNEEDALMKVFWSILISMAIAGSVFAIPLQQVYDEALPGAGYDKMIVLDPAESYTGGLQFDNLDVCILSYGAVVDLQGDRIIVDPGAMLDVCGVVLTNSDSAALKYNTLAQGWVDRCTFYNNYEALFFWNNADLTITSNILSYSSHWGVRTHEDADRWMGYNDAWQNTAGNYYEWCSG